MRRRLPLVLAAVVVVAAVVTALYLLRWRRDTTTTVVGVDQAVDDFRHTTSTTEGAARASTSIATPAPLLPELPAPGVYRYTTVGGDQIDALGGAAHRYPATSTITVTASGCGVSQRWVAAEERSDEHVTCAVPGAIELVSFTAFHRFFGTDDLEPHQCLGEPRPVDAAPGTTWTVTCPSGDEVNVWTGTVLGREALAVGGAEVVVDHVLVAIDDGRPENVQRTETWYRRGTDLVVRRVVDNVTTSSSPIGDVHYREHFEIRLDSLTPER
jgi:hypothetical protein